jgi:hypothetical protein
MINQARTDVATDVFGQHGWQSNDKKFCAKVKQSSDALAQKCGCAIEVAMANIFELAYQGDTGAAELAVSEFRIYQMLDPVVDDYLKDNPIF